MRINKLFLLVALSFGVLGCEFLFNNPSDPYNDTDEYPPHGPYDTDIDTATEYECNLECLPGWECITDRCVRVLSDSENTPRAIATDDTHVYWVTEGTWDDYNNYYFDGAVRKVSKDGGAVVELASDLDFPDAISVDATYVYWLTADSLMRVPVGGGTPETLAATMTYPRTLKMDATHLYWIEANTTVNPPESAYEVKSMPKDGSSQPTVLVTIEQINDFLLDDGYLYWSYGTYGDLAIGIERAPLSDTTQLETVASGESAEAWNIAIDDSHLYWTAGYEGPDSCSWIAKTAKDGGQSMTTTLDLPTECVHAALAMSDDDLYFGGSESGVLRVMKNTKQPGGTELVWTLPGASLADLATDSTDVFIASEDSIFAIRP